MTIPTLSDHIAQSAVCNVLDVLHGQLEEQIRRSVKANPTVPNYLQRPFVSQHGWITSRPYSDMKFQFQYAEFTFLQVCNAFELMHGISIQYLFMEELTKQVKESVRKVLEERYQDMEAGECEKSVRSCGKLN